LFEVRGVQKEEGKLACDGAAIYESKRVRIRCEYEGYGTFEVIAIERDVPENDGDKWVKEPGDVFDET
jgi:hypothetical protein